jgi:drug/metabolite transporter (DMT)-like permease
LSGDLIALLSALLWAMASVLMALIGRRLAPFPLNLIRTIVSTSFFWCLLPFFGGLAAVAAIEPGQWLWLALSVLLLLVVGDLLYLRSMEMAGVSWAMPVASVNPLWAVLFAALLIDEPLTARLFMGAVLVVGGVILVSQSTTHAEPVDRRRQQIGLLMALLASLSWGLGQIVLKVATTGLHSVVANSVRQPMGAAAMLGLNLLRPHWGSLRRLPGRSWGIIVFASLVGTGVGSLLFVQAIQMVGAGRTAVLTSTAPLMAIPFAMVWLGERPNRRTLAGTLLAVVGIVLVA